MRKTNFIIPNKAAGSAWLRCFQGHTSLESRLICLPHAGGSASFFKSWVADVPDNVELYAVQYPGREERLADTCLSDMHELVSILFKELTNTGFLSQKPYILFGHSMSGNIAYELCLELAKHRYPLPEQLVISASEVPAYSKAKFFHDVSDEKLIEEIVRLNNDIEPLLQNKELLNIILPTLRADYALIEGYIRPQKVLATLGVPILLVLGEEDTELSIEDAKQWQHQTTKAFDYCIFEGDHFYLAKKSKNIIDQIYSSFNTTFSNENNVSQDESLSLELP